MLSNCYKLWKNLRVQIRKIKIGKDTWIQPASNRSTVKYYKLQPHFKKVIYYHHQLFPYQKIAHRIGPFRMVIWQVIPGRIFQCNGRNSAGRHIMTWMKDDQPCCLITLFVNNSNYLYVGSHFIIECTIPSNWPLSLTRGQYRALGNNACIMIKHYTAYIIAFNCPVLVILMGWPDTPPAQRGLSELISGPALKRMSKPSLHDIFISYSTFLSEISV